MFPRQVDAPENNEKMPEDKLDNAFIRYVIRNLNDHATETGLSPQTVHSYVKALIATNPECLIFLLQARQAVYINTDAAWLTREKKSKFLLRLTSLDCVSRGLDCIVQSLRLHPEYVKERNLHADLGLLDFLIAFPNNIQTYKEMKYGVIDDRVHLSHEPIVRRFDSLSRLFRIMAGHSVCTAVAVHNGELIISANANDNHSSDVIVNVIKQRMKVLTTHFASIRKMSRQEYYENHTKLNTVIYEKLNNIHPTVYTKEIITQALHKVTDAIFFDASTFNDAIKQVFLKPNIAYRVLTPFLNNDALVFSCSTYDPNEDLFQREFVMLNFKSSLISSAHAEQILAYFILKTQDATQYSKEAPLVIGISKLCCQGCIGNLQHQPVLVRGMHGEVVKDTINFFNGELALKEPTTPICRTTHAEPSPHESAEQRHVADPIRPLNRNACRRLFNADENVETDVIIVPTNRARSLSMEFFAARVVEERIESKSPSPRK